MLNQKFYWGTIRKGIVAFGNLFNNLHIDRRDKQGNVVQTLRVPLAYAPRQKFIARIQAYPEAQTESFQTFLPRMGFEMLSIEYDPNRRISLVQQNRAVNSTANTLNAQYAPSPYNLNIGLYIYAKNQDDGLQIIEQILPYFNPDFNLSLNAIPQLGIKNDLPILLQGINYEDQYEGDFTSRRSIIWTLNFVMKMNFFGPINKQGIIKSVNVDTFSNGDLSQRYQNYNVTVTPDSVLKGNVTSDNFIEDFTEF